MPEYLLDTHACLFALAAPQKLGGRARQALAQADRQGEIVWIPAAVAVEIVLLKELGRTDLGIPALRDAFARTSWRFLNLDFEQIDEFAVLGALDDPFDRLIVAAARRTRAKLISRDARLARSGLVDVLWD